MGELQVSLGATRVQAHKRLPLFLGLQVLLLTNKVSRLLSADLRHDECWVCGHGHLQWGGALINVSISWECSDLEWEGDRLVVQLCWDNAGTGKGEDLVTTSRADHGVRVVFQRHCSGSWYEHARDRRLGRRWEVWVLGMLLRLVGPHHCLLGHLGLHVVDGGGGRGVVGTELMVRHWRAGIDGCWVRGWGEFLMLQEAWER